MMRRRNSVKDGVCMYCMRVCVCVCVCLYTHLYTVGTAVVVMISRRNVMDLMGDDLYTH